MGNGNRKDWYFGGGTLEGAGPLYFLKIPKRAQSGDEALSLIGSFVKKIDYGGLLGAFDKECPEPNSEYAPMLAAKQLAQIAGEPVEALYSEDFLPGAKRSFKGLKKFGIDGEGTFPGAPVSAGLKLDYKKIKTIDISFGEGSFVRDLRIGYLKDGLRKIRAHPEDYSSGFFDKDMMIIERILVARNLAITVNMKSTLEAGFDAKLEAENAVHGALNYSSNKKETVVLSMADDVPYLFGISGIRHVKMKV